jgi:hypothetical protein
MQILLQMLHIILKKKVPKSLIEQYVKLES